MKLKIKRMKGVVHHRIDGVLDEFSYRHKVYNNILSIFITCIYCS
jgi:hypothetical protein